MTNPSNNNSQPSKVFTPQCEEDFDAIDQTVLEYGKELDADHPGFHDTEYRARRALIVSQALSYRSGAPIPRVAYTDEENATWQTAYAALRQLYPTHACATYNACLQKLAYPEDRVPQLEDVSQKLQRLSGWKLRPVAGLLTSRQFLAGLAFRIFFSTQYIRHPSAPMYTAEPDVIHDVVGHVPMLADETFARFSELIGRASLGVSDAEITRLATVYWFSLEFGLCREADGQLRAYGAGLLSSYGELQYALGNENENGENKSVKKPELRPFEPLVVCEQPYPITTYQPVYFVADSFERAQQQMLEYIQTRA